MTAAVYGICNDFNTVLSRVGRDRREADIPADYTDLLVRDN